MPQPGRRAALDNLDPLVDTLSNVVGILVIVVVLSQIQLGDALARVAEIDLLRTREERARELMPAEFEALRLRRDAILRRTDRDLEASIVLAKEMLSALSDTPFVASERGLSQSPGDLREERDRVQAELGALRILRDQRERYVEQLTRVPKRLVARLPDPQIVRGKESWIIVRNRRVYLVDRPKLFEAGQKAIGRVLGDGLDNRTVRPDEFEATARYLRKLDVGAGQFRWHLAVEPELRVELVLRSLDGGLEVPGLGSKSAMRSWLASRSPDIDFIRFHVWADSFEAYLAARQLVESAGFRAGWRGYEIEEELSLALRLGGPAEPDIGPILVD